MPLVKRPSGLIVRTFDAPPAGVELGDLHEDDLVRFGLPSRAAEPAALARWEERLRRYRFVTPRFRPRKTRRQRLPSLRLEHEAEQTSSWAGAIAFPQPGDRLCSADGAWAMPSVAVPIDSTETQFCASTWLGLDGDDGSQDVLQAGCDADLTASGGAVQHQYLPWWEWYPAGSDWITNMPVSPGDVLACSIRLAPQSTVSASIFLANRTTGVALTFSAQAPPGTALSGNCAEWIVEAYGSLGPLARFTEVSFTGCGAGSTAGAAVDLTAADTIEMMDASGAVISSGAIVGPSEVQVRYGPG